MATSQTPQYPAPPSGVVQNPGETPAQTAARYAADYHSPDSSSVIAAANAWATPKVTGYSDPSNPPDPFDGGGTVSTIPVPQTPPTLTPNPTTPSSVFTPVIDPTTGKAKTGTGTPLGGDIPGGIKGIGSVPVGPNGFPGSPSEIQNFSAILASYPNNPQAAIDAFNAKYPNSALKPQYYPDKKVIGVAGQPLPYMTAPGTASGQTFWEFGGVPGGDSGNSTASGPTIQGDVNSIPTLPGSQNPLPSNSANDLYSTLMARAGQSLDVNPNDPIIKGQTNAFGASQTDQMRKYLAGVAEKSGPYGDTGAENRSANETVGQNTSQFQAALMQNELTARRTEIQNALTEQGSLLSDQQRIQLQSQLGLLDASLRQQQINSGNDQFAANFGLSATDAAWLHNWISMGGNG